MGLSDIQEPATRLDKLRVLAERLAHDIDLCDSAKDLAGLSKQYRETLREIEEIEEGSGEDDEIAEILADRRAEGKPGAVR